MAEQPTERADLLRQEYLAQTSRIAWQDLQAHYAHGSVVAVAGHLDLIEVAVQLGLDNTAAFSAWIEAGDVAPVSDAQAQAFFAADTMLWAVVAAPWVLVQDRD